MASAPLSRILTYPAGYLLFTATHNPIVVGSMVSATPVNAPQLATIGRKFGQPHLSIQGAPVKDALNGRAFVIVRNGQAALFLQPAASPAPKFSPDALVYPLSPTWLQSSPTECHLNLASSVRIPLNILSMHEPELRALVRG